MKLQFITLAIAMIFLMGIASATIPITNCTTINQSGVYELQNDINFSSDSACIQILTNDTILDGKGFTIYNDAETIGGSYDVIVIVGNNGASAGGFNNITLMNIKGVATNNATTGIAIWGRHSGGVSPNTNVKIYNISLVSFNDPLDFEGVSNLEGDYIYLDTTNIDEALSIYMQNALNVSLNHVSMNHSNLNAFSVYWLISSGNDGFIANLSHITNYGKITFNQLDLSTLNDVYWNEQLDITDNNAFIDGVNRPELNLSSHITLMGLPFTNPKVLRDGVDCPINVCTNLQYSNGVAQFDVTGWSNYSLEEQPTVTITQSNLIQGSGAIYEVLNSAGSGLGIFLQMIGSSLPLLLIGLAFVGIVVVVAWSIKRMIDNNIKRGGI